MKRRVGVIMLLLVAGAILNVAVAWGLAVFCEIRQQDDTWIKRTMPQPPLWWTQHDGSFREAGHHQIMECRLAGFGRKGTMLFAEFVVWRIMQAGSPCASLEHALEFDLTVRASGALALPKHWASDDMSRAFLPLRPIWPGFAINTLFYAGILWLLFAAPFALRRRRRIKRGLCPGCAYPVGDSTVCTECGKPVNARLA